MKGVMKKCKQYCISGFALALLVSLVPLNIMADVTDGLLVHYPLDGNAVDVGGSGLNGSVEGATSTQDRNRNPSSAMTFSSGNYIQTPFVPQFTQSDVFSISVWIRSRNDTGDPLRVLGLERGSDQELHIVVLPNAQGGKAQFRVRDDSNNECDIRSVFSVNDNEWHHIAAIRGDSLMLYIDGLLVAEINDATTDNVNYEDPQWMAIGANNHDPRGIETYFRGDIDDLRFYDRVLSQEEVRELAELNINSGLVAYYPLDGTPEDASDNDNHLILYGTLWSADRYNRVGQALYFNGIDDRAESALSIPISGNHDRTIAFWFNPSRVVPDKAIAIVGWGTVDYVGGLSFVKLYPENNPFFNGHGDDTGSAWDAVSLDDWSHIAFVQKDGIGQMFVNGQGYNTDPNDLNTLANTLKIARDTQSHPDYNEYFEGQIDEVRIYDRALSATEIKYLYSGYDELLSIITKIPEENNHTMAYANQYCSKSGKGSPIFVQSGDYRTRMDDAVLPCRGLPLQITRFYNSIEDYDGPFSYGWCFNQTVQLMESLNTNGQETAVVRWANGVRKDFVFTNDAYDAPLGCFDVLTTNAAGFVLEMKSGMKLFFNPGGFLTNQTDRYGNAVTYEHDLRNRISQVESADGRTLNYSYDEDINRVTNITDWSGRSWSYSYSTNDDLVGVTYPDGATISYTFDGDHHLTGIYDALGHQVSSLTYAEDSGRAMSYSEGAAVDYTFEYSSASNYTKKTDSLGRDHGFTYNEFGNKINKVDPAGNEMLFTWTGDQQINSKTDHRGYPQFFEYDNRGNVIMASNALGYVTRYTYETNYNQVTSITDPLGNVVTNTYDQYGNLLESTDARDFTVHYQYDQYGQLTNVVNAEGHASAMSYNEHGELVTVYDPLDNTMTYAYNSRGDRVSMTDPRGNTWTYGYDVMGRLVASTNPLGQVVSYEYDANGNRVAVTDARTNTTRFAYDEYNRLIAVTNALGIEAGRMVYDLYGNVVATYDALGNVASNTYDILNRLVTATDPLGNPTSFAYDENGNRTAVTDAMNNVTSYGFDPLNRMSAMTNALDDVWQYDYDANHNLLAVTDANSHTSTNAYDARNMVTNSSNPLGHAYRYEYDGNGNILERQDPNGATFYYAYDAASRLTNIAYPDGSALTFTHDANGNVLSMSNRSETVCYAYDVLNRVTNVLVVGLNKNVSYEYDATGNRSAMIDPDGGRTEYEYDALNRLVELRDPETNAWVFSYDAANRMTNMVMANGINATYQYDKGSRLTNLVYRKSDTNILQSFAYTYDAVGNPLRVKREDNLYELYEYDNTYQLTHVDYDSSDTVGPGPRWTDYQYDPIGNRTNLANEAFTETYIYDAANRLLSVSSPLTTETLQWDDNGNLTNRLEEGSQSEAYTWDFDNKMVEIRYADGSTNTFEYYPGGLRLSKTLGGNTAINGRFESPAVAKTNETEAVPSGWAWFSSIARDAGITRRVKRSGGQAIYFTSRESNSAYQGVSLPMPVVTGKTYRFEVHALNDAGVPMAGNMYGQLSIEWKNETGGEISRTWGPSWGPSLSTDTWASVAVTGVAPIDAVSASFVISAFEGNPAGNGTFFVDDAVIEVIGETPERTEQYVYDGQNLLQEYDGLGRLMAQYVYSLGIDSLLARSAGGSQDYYLRDMIGSVTGIADTNQALIASYHYDVFGSVRKGWGGEDNSYLFTSRRLDQDSGLYYYRARYAGSGVGRFTSFDPVGQKDGYAYTGNRPVKHNDPLGLYIEHVWGYDSAAMSREELMGYGASQFWGAAPSTVLSYVGVVLGMLSAPAAATPAAGLWAGSMAYSVDSSLANGSEMFAGLGNWIKAQSMSDEYDTRPMEGVDFKPVRDLAFRPAVQAMGGTQCDADALYDVTGLALGVLSLLRSAGDLANQSQSASAQGLQAYWADSADDLVGSVSAQVARDAAQQKFFLDLFKISKGLVGLPGKIDSVVQQ